MAARKKVAAKTAPKKEPTLFERIEPGMTLNIEGLKLRVIYKTTDSLTVNKQGAPIEWSRTLIDNYPAGGIGLS